VAKHNDQHLATEQLSAFLDQHLSPEEQAAYKTHLQDCQQCQDALATLRQTVALLKALPQPELPRSFALPLGVSYLQERSEEGQEQREVGRTGRSRTTSTDNQSVPRPLWLYYLQRTTRVASTIAAVIGLAFLLSTVLPSFHGGASSTGSAPSNTSIGGNTVPGKPSSTSAVKGMAPHGQTAVPSTVDKDKTPVIVSPSQVVSQGHNQQVQGQGQNALPVPDIGTGLGRQEIGFFLLILGIVGFLLTRRRLQRRL